MRNDQACDTLGSDYEDVKEDPDIVMDQFSTDCPGIQNNKERNEQITSGIAIFIYLFIYLISTK